MKPHPYVRAYIAGVAVPTIFIPIAFASFFIARLVYRVDAPVERIIVFPLAFVPSLWGLWNTLWVALHGRRRLPLGLHGAVTPLIFVPLGVSVAHLNGFEIPGFLPATIAVVLPVAVIFYYLIWKYAVGFLNALLGIA
jgi:hypothetical protein